jgi:SPP1 gp7 family putative phage head morphogenesis protein
MCVLGKAPDQAINTIAKRMNVSKGQAGRLIMTEAAYFGSAAQKDCFNDLDVEKYEIVATLDNRTSDVCQEMDGKVFDMKDFEAGVTAPPFHVWCRSCTCPWFPDNDDGTRAARGADGQTYQVPASMKYEDWKNTFVNGGSKDGMTPASVDDIVEAVEKVRTIKDCKTVEEVEDFFKEQDWFIHGMDGNPNWRSDEGLSLKGCDLECAKAVYESYEQFFGKYPTLIGKLAAPTTGNLGASTYAQCMMGFSSGQVTVNKKWFSNYEKMIKSVNKDIEVGFHPVGVSDRTSIVIHELGHSLDDHLTNVYRPYGMVNNWKPKYVSAALRPKVMKACGLKVNDILKEVSEYATKDHFEWFVELFSEYMTSENPRPVAVEFGRQLEELMKGIEWK